MMRATIALATCREIPEPDLDEGPLLDALASAGVPVELVAWDDPGVDWARFAACVIRSTWNYFEQPTAFLDWCERAARETRLLNPPDVVAWNHHKRYLLELESRGLPVVPTALVTRGSDARLERILEERGWSEVVVKPAVSAGSFRTARFGAGQAAEAGEFLAELSSDVDALVQRFEPSVARGGERALVWIDGAFTHAITKEPRFIGDEEQVSASQPLREDDRALAERVIAPFAERLLYGRVDVIEDADGRPQLAELELIEPSLFVARDATAMARLVTALERLTTPS